MGRTIVLFVGLLLLVPAMIQATPTAQIRDTGTEGETGWGDPAGHGVRPGVDILGSSCTANFVFSDPANTTFYIGTAAHCVDDQDIGDLVRINHGQALGTLVYSSWKTMDTSDDLEGSCDTPASNDFALVRIDDGDESEVHPAMLGFGGPTAMGSVPAVGDKVMTYGNSNLRFGANNDREGYVATPARCISSIYTAAPGLPGDSGSPVIQGDGTSLGVLVTLEFAPVAGSNGVVMLDQAVDFMERNTDLDVELKTYRVTDPGLLPQV